MGRKCGVISDVLGLQTAQQQDGYSAGADCKRGLKSDGEKLNGLRMSAKRQPCKESWAFCALCSGSKSNGLLMNDIHNVKYIECLRGQTGPERAEKNSSR